MEKTLKLRKPSIKKLVDLLIVAEEMLFSFPVPVDLRSKYERMRGETFTKLRIRNNGIPMTPALFEEEKGKASLNKIVILELLNSIQQSFLLIEAFEEELSFKTVTLKNFFNSLAVNPEKIDLKSARARKSEDFTLWSNLEFDEQLEKIKEKLNEKKSDLNEIKMESESIEKTLMERVNRLKNSVFEERNEPNVKDFQEEYKKLNEKFQNLSKELEKTKKNQEIMKDEYEAKLKSLKDEVKFVKLEESNTKFKENTEKHEKVLIELVTLKQKQADLEISLSKSLSKSESLQETNNQLSSSNHLLKEKIASLKAALKKSSDSEKDLEKTLEYERSTFELHLSSFQKELFNQQTSLKQVQEENLSNLSDLHKQELQETILKFEATLQTLNSEITHYKKQLSQTEESSKQMIKSLQLELFKSKELLSQQYEKFSEHSKSIPSESLLFKLETRVISMQNCLKHIAELLHPIYLSYSSHQQDWDEEFTLKSLLKVDQEHAEILILSEFSVFLLEKTLKDKAWLITKLEEMQSKIAKTNSVGTLASPSSFRDKGLYRQIWQDVKETSLVLEKFERCRENLLSQFVFKQSPH
jgi:hypothetical protein